MKILHILDHSVPLHSGYSFRTLSILKQQRALGWTTIQLTTPKHTMPSAPCEEVDGFTFYRTDAPAELIGRLPVLREAALVSAVAKRIEQVVEIERPDLLHAHSPVLNALAALRVGWKLGLPTVYEVRAFWEDAAVDLGTASPGSLRYRATRALETFALRRCDAITTICEGLRGDMLKRGLPSEKIVVIPNAVDPDEFDFGGSVNEALRHRLDLDGKVVLGFIGSFYSYEGLDLLVRALPVLRAARPEIALLLVGGGPVAEQIKALAAEQGVADAIRFVGRVPHDEVSAYYGLVDLLVYPRHSQRLTELVTPLKPLEAMARGRLVLASDVGGHRELIRDGETGFLFRADDVSALAKAALDILANPVQWPRIRDQARRFVEDERTWAASVSRYRETYARALSFRREAKAA
jgi:PEP-CTERM/exosortase A-associated glycosyltransferase